MTKHSLWVLLGSAFLFPIASVAQAEDRIFTWEGEIEVGIESVFSSNVPGNDGEDPFLTFEQVGELSLGQYFSIVGGLTLEEMTGPSNSIDDLGLYVDTLALQAGLGRVTLQAGKSAPVFGTAFDDAASYFGSTLADDYELTEQIGLFAEVEVSEAGNLALGVFYADNTGLSRSLGFSRPKNRTSAGGAGNTGELDNVAIQFMQELGDGFFHVGARHLSKGTGDLSDETGFILGGGYSFAERGTPLDLYFEVASFDGFGGTLDDAVYATLTAAYAITERTEVSAVITHRDIDSVGDTNVYSIGFDYELENGITIGSGIGIVDDAGADENIFGVSMIIPLG